MKKSHLILGLILIILALVCGYFKFGWHLKLASNQTDSKDLIRSKLDTKTATETKLIPCTSLATDQPKQYPNWQTKLYSAPLTEASSNDGVISNNISNFSLKGLIAKTEANSIYYRVQRTNFPTDYVTGSKVVLEVCNAQNQTASWNSTSNADISASGEKISARITHLHSNPKVLKPGNYRIDAYVYIDNSWHLTNRLEAINLTE